MPRGQYQQAEPDPITCLAFVVIFLFLWLVAIWIGLKVAGVI